LNKDPEKYVRITDITFPINVLSLLMSLKIATNAWFSSILSCWKKAAKPVLKKAACRSLINVRWCRVLRK